MRRIVAVDVDQTIVDTAYPWWQWLENISGKGLPYDVVSSTYDFTKMYETELREMGIDGLDYWRQKNLYDDLEPLPYAVEALELVSKIGDVIFVSVLKGDHHKSKYYFLKKHFPFMQGLIGTKEKRFVHCDMAIDDRNENLDQFRKYNNCEIVRFDTPHGQYIKDPEDTIVLENWREFLTKVEEVVNC
jgi:5'(3')-deoxyribonucleotidase